MPKEAEGYPSSIILTVKNTGSLTLLSGDSGLLCSSMYCCVEFRVAVENILSEKPEESQVAVIILVLPHSISHSGSYKIE